MRKRRKTRYTWLPIDATQIDGTESVVNVVPFQMATVVNIGEGGDARLPHTSVVGVLNDFYEGDLDTATASLADTVGSEYFIKRIVGKCFVELTGAIGGSIAEVASSQRWPTALCKVGLFVAPANEGRLSPVGTNDGTFTSERYDPFAIQANREPWIWQRSWLLTAGGSEDHWAGDQSQFEGRETGAILASSLSQVGLNTWPNNNARYGSVADGPHIDAKTARRVRQHERLFASLSVLQWPLNTNALTTPAFGQMTALASLDLRILGGLRKARNRSSFE